MAMLMHTDIWEAIDQLASRHDLTPSGLARLAGLDATTFNKSKRIGRDGRARWPSTESLAKVLEATGENFDSFLAGAGTYSQPEHASIQGGSHGGLNAGLHDGRGDTVPLLGFAQAGAGGYFDASGFPAGQGWDEVRLPTSADGNAYALEVTGDSMLPLYRDGDIIIVSPTEQLRRGDRVVVRTAEGEVMAKILHRQTATQVELHSLNPEHEPRVLPLESIDWFARILWASQ